MLWLTQEQAKRLVDAAEAAHPEEACALLIGRRGLGLNFRVARVEFSPNVAADKARRFEIDPGLRIGLERELRGQAEQVIGVWHSHPNGLAEPSATDAAMIYEPDLVWLITAVVPGVAAGQAIQTAAFVPMQSGKFGVPATPGGGGFRPIGFGILPAE
jgi:proteasome lid subunit RPN8/RPN11